MTDEDDDPYGVLGISPSASTDEIKKRYRQLAKEFHPDSGCVPNAEKFAKAASAYGEVNTDKKREDLAKQEAQDAQKGAAEQAAQEHAAKVRANQKRRVREREEAERQRQAAARAARPRTEANARAFGDQFTGTSKEASPASTFSSPYSRNPQTSSPISQSQPTTRRWLGVAVISTMVVLIIIVVLAASGGGKAHSSAAIPTPVAPTKTPEEVEAETVARQEQAAEERIATLSFKCVERYVCHADPDGHPLPLFIDGMDENLRDYLEERGYRDIWTDSAGGIEGQTIGPRAAEIDDAVHYVATTGAETGRLGIGTGLTYGADGERGSQTGEGIEPWDFSGKGRWNVSWTLWNPSGQIVRRLHYSVKMVTCGIGVSPYCDAVGKYESNGAAVGDTIAYNGSYSKRVYTPPPAFPYRTAQTTAKPVREVYLGPITGVRVHQLSRTMVRVSWSNPDDPDIFGFMILGNDAEDTGQESSFDTGIDPQATSITEDIDTWQQSRPSRGESWVFCVSPFGHWTRSQGYQEIPERQGCSPRIRWR